MKRHPNSKHTPRPKRSYAGKFIKAMTKRLVKPGTPK